MTPSEFKKVIKKSEIVVDLSIMQQYKVGHSYRWVDPRTQKNYWGYYAVYPIAITDIQVFIVCPYCGEVHCHGRSSDKSGVGYRCPHCCNKPKDAKSYFIRDNEETRMERYTEFKLSK